MGCCSTDRQVLDLRCDLALKLCAGTGKTLVARALANTCSQGGQRVSFFMRKGADILSKWVGEAERQLRLLFDQVRKRPNALSLRRRN